MKKNLLNYKTALLPKFYFVAWLKSHPKHIDHKLILTFFLVKCYKADNIIKDLIPPLTST